MRKLPSSKCQITLLPWILITLQPRFCVTGAVQIDHISYFEPVHYDVGHLHHVTKRSTSQPIRFDFRAFRRQFPIRLERDHSVHHPSMVVETDQGRQFYYSNRIYRGLVLGESSKVHGVVTKDGLFEGKLYLPDETFIVERSKQHFEDDVEFHTIIYRTSDITFNTSSPTCAHEKLHMKQKEVFSKDMLTQNYNRTGSDIDGTINEWQHKYDEKINKGSPESVNYDFLYERKKRAVDPAKVTCELYLQADHLYYQKYGSDEDVVIEKLTQHVQAVNTIYNTKDFDGSGSSDNIGFIIKKIKIYTDPTADGYKYPANYAVDYFLELHSEDNYDDFCLSYMFTNRDFSNGVLGLAWIADLSSLGGVCEKYTTVQGTGKSLNTGIVSELNYGTAVPSAVTQVTFAHEIGHNFGSGHDPEEDSTCTPGGDTGNYIMYARATSGLKSNNDEFSSCSIASIKPILEQKARDAGGCFVEFKDEICGNRVVEGDEECDCGWADECTEGCCNPQVSDLTGVETPCTRKSTAVCSPSQGPCCDASCQYAGSTVLCRSQTVCMDSANCSGSSFECPASGHRANQTECGDDNDYQVCYNGECTSAVCMAYGRETCQCTPDTANDWTDIKLCQVCCMDGPVCKSSYDLADIPDQEVASGMPCLDFQGYCDVFKKCRLVNPEGPLSNLRRLLASGEVLETLKGFLTKHWYISVAAGVTMIISIIIYTVKRRLDADSPSGVISTMETGVIPSNGQKSHVSTKASTTIETSTLSRSQMKNDHTQRSLRTQISFLNSSPCTPHNALSSRDQNQRKMLVNKNIFVDLDKSQLGNANMRFLGQSRPEFRRACNEEGRNQFAKELILNSKELRTSTNVPGRHGQNLPLHLT